MKDKPNFVEVKPPKLKREWKGCTVRTVRDIKNSFFAIPAGTIATITHQTTIGSELTAAPCSCCGIQAIISRVPPTDFVFVDPAEVDHD